MKRHKRMNRRMTNRLKSTVSVLLASSMVLNPLNGIQIAIGSELNSTRVTVKGSKADINLSSAALREAAVNAIQNGVTFTPEAYVGLDTATDAAFENLLTQGSSLYELDLFDAEDQDVFTEAGIDVKLLIQKDPKAEDADLDTEIASASNLKRKTNVSFDYQARAANKGKEILFYQKGSPLDSLIGNLMLEDINHADLTEAETVEDNSSYVLTGSETVTILYMNTAKDKHTFKLSVDGKAFSGSVTVEGNESAVSKLKKQLKKDAKEELTGTTEATAEVTEATTEETTKADATETAAVDQDNAVEPETAAKAEESSTAADSMSAAETEESTSTEAATEAETQAETRTEAQTEEVSQEETTEKETEAQTEKEVKEEEATAEVEQLTKNTVTAIGSFTLQNFFDEAESQDVETAEAEEKTTEAKTEAKEEKTEAEEETTAKAEETTTEAAAEAEKQTEAAKEETTAAKEETTAEETTAENKETTAESTEETTAAEETTAESTVETAAAETEESKETEAETKVITAMDESLAEERAQLLSEQTVETLAENTVSAKAVQYTLDDLTSDFKSVDLGAYLVKVYPVADNAIDNSWTLKATELLKDDQTEADAKTENPETMSTETAEALKGAGIYDNSASLDIHFEDADGNEVEPNGKVRVEIEVAKEALDENATSLSVYHVEEKNGSIQDVKALDTTTQALDQNGNTLADSKAIVTETVENTEAVAAVAETEDKNSTAATQTVEKYSDEVAKVKTSFTVESFSTFTITWGDSTSTLKIITEDENGDELTAFGVSSIKLSEGETYYFDEDDNHFFVPNYAVANAYYENGEEDVEVRSAALVEDKVVLYDNDDRKVTNGKSLTVHLQYRDDVAPNIMAVSEDGDSVAPEHHKELSLNNDGTYTLSLDVTGKSSQSTTSEKADVIVVLDVSESMNFKYTQVDQPTTNDKTYYGYTKVDDKDTFPELTYRNNKWYLNGKEYKGDFYVAIQNNKSRLDIAKAALNSLAEKLDGSVNKIALVTFAKEVKLTKEYSEISDFKDAINGQLNTASGTNWVAALNEAKRKLTDWRRSDSTTKTYIIFISDGEPNKGGTDKKKTGYAKHGKPAADIAKDCVNPENLNATLYAVAALGKVENMGTFAADAYGDETEGKKHWYSAANSENLNKAFANIAKKITKAENYANVKITDVLTEDTEIDASSFTYRISNGTTTYNIQLDANKKISTINGSTSTVAQISDSNTGKTYTYRVGDAFPAASHEEASKTVTWDLSTYQDETFGLPDGWTYTVMFKVWPNQNAYDNAADWKNETKTYNESTDGTSKKGYVKDGDDYKLKSNAEAKVTYKTVKYETGQEPEYSDERTSAYSEFPTMALTVAPIKLEKVWSDGNADHSDKVVTMRISDGSTSASIELNSTNGWTKTWYLAPGLNDGKTNLDEGHTYTISELKVMKDAEDVTNQYKASFRLNDTDVTGNSVSVKPMLVPEDSTSTIVIKDMVNDSITWGTNYQVTTTNTPIQRQLTIQKTVTGTGAVVDATNGYKFTVKITGPDGAALTEAEKSMIGGWNTANTDITEGRDTDTYTVVVKPSKVGEAKSSAAILLPAGYQYQITEDKSNCQNYKTTVDGVNGDGMAQAATLNNDATVSFVNTYDIPSPTGVHRDILPYVISMGIALAGAAMLLLELQRKRRMSE